MRIDPIEYTPWNGERTGLILRVFVIIKKIFKQNIKSKGVLVLLILGIILAHLFPIMSTVFIPRERLSADIVNTYMKDGFFALFSILLAAVVTSSLISSDYQDNSFVLYFSRPIKPAVYMFSKLFGAALVMALFCFLPPIIYCITVMGTQTGPDYWSGLKVTGMTVAAGLLTVIYFSSMGLMLSSLTKRKAYAGVGTFIAFLAPMTLSEFFVNFNVKWRLLNPIVILHYSFDLIYGFRLPDYIEFHEYLLSFLAYLFIPMAVTYYILQRRAVGK